MPEPTAPMPAEPRAPVISTRVRPPFAAPSSLAAVVAALAAVASTAGGEQLGQHAHGHVDASLSGVLSSFMIDVADVEDVDEDRSPWTQRCPRACGDARLCRA